MASFLPFHISTFHLAQTELLIRHACNLLLLHSWSPLQLNTPSPAHKQDTQVGRSRISLLVNLHESMSSIPLHLASLPNLPYLIASISCNTNLSTYVCKICNPPPPQTHTQVYVQVMSSVVHLLLSFVQYVCMYNLIFHHYNLVLYYTIIY